MELDLQTLKGWKRPEAARPEAARGGGRRSCRRLLRRLFPFLVGCCCQVTNEDIVVPADLVGHGCGKPMPVCSGDRWPFTDKKVVRGTILGRIWWQSTVIVGHNCVWIKEIHLLQASRPLVGRLGWWSAPPTARHIDVMAV